MKHLKLLLLLSATLVRYSLYSQALSADAAGRSVILAPGGSAGVDLQRGMFNANYTFFSSSLYSKTTPVTGFSFTGGNRAGMTDILKNGVTASTIELRLHGGVSISNEFAGKYNRNDVYVKNLNTSRSELEDEMRRIQNDTTYKVSARKIFVPFPAEYVDTIINIYDKYFPSEDLINKGLMQFLARYKGPKNAEMEYAVKSFVEDVNYLLTIYADRGKMLVAVQKQLADTARIPKEFVRTTFFASGGFQDIRYTDISFLRRGTDSFVVTSQKVNTYFTGMVGINHQFGKNWFIGYGIGTETHDNFENLQRYEIDTGRSFQGSQARISQKTTGYQGAFIQKQSLPFLFQFTYVKEIGDGGRVIFTPLYLSAGKRVRYGASAALVMKNRISLGINVEKLELTSTLTNTETVGYTTFGFNIRYLLLDFGY